MWGFVHQLSVPVKINLTLVAVMLYVIVAVMYFTANNERGLALQLIKQQTIDTADSYFDSINTMMISGTMANSGLLRDKILSRPGIVDARIIRGKQVIKLYGEGKPENHVKDGLDSRALQGEKIIQLSDSAQGRILTVVDPVRASENYRGTNCLGCHQTTSGTVLGAVRISYSLQDIDKQVSWHLISSGVVYLVLFLIGGGIYYFMLRRIVTRPLHKLHDAVQHIEQHADLTLRLPVNNRDEISTLARVFNEMLAKFQHIIEEVHEGTKRLTESTGQISTASEHAVAGMLQQQKETELAATAMTELTSTAQEVAKKHHSDRRGHPSRQCRGR